MSVDNYENMHEFSNIIFNKVQSNNIEYVDAITTYCEEKGIEIDSIVSLISPALKSKIEEEALSLRLIKQKTRTLIF